MNIGTITIGKVEDLEPKEAAVSLANSCRDLAQLIVNLNQEVDKLTERVARIEQNPNLR